MVTVDPYSVSPATERQMAISKIVLYAMIGAIALVLIIIIIVIICLCKRRKRRKEAKAPTMEMKILDDEEREPESKSLLCGRSKKKKSTPSDNAPILPSAPPYEPGTMMEGVYERVSSADIETKYDCFLPKANEKIEVPNTYVTIGRSNSFNPKRDRPVVKTRDESARNVKRNESIKLIETGLGPSETYDVKARLLEIQQAEPSVRVKQKRTSNKKGKASPTLKTHELVRITPPVTKKDLNKTNRITDNHKLLHTAGGAGVGVSKPASVSGASVVSSNDGSEAASNLGTDSGYEDINSENSPTVKRVEGKTFDDALKSEHSNSTHSSPIVSSRKNYIDVEVVACSRLLEQRSNSIIARRNSKRPDDDTNSSSFDDSVNYTQVSISSQYLE